MIKHIGLFVAGMVLTAAAVAQTTSTNEQKNTAPLSSERETVLDRKVHIESEWVKEIPEVPRLCDKLGLKKQKINIGDCELYCDEEGSGMPIVLLHGGPGATHHYFHPWFANATNFARIIYYDQRGCGLSDYKRGSGYTTGQAVDDLEALRIALKIDKWIVAGHSYGGYVAQQYAVKYPDHLAGLVLIGASEAVKMQLGTRQYDYITKEERQKISAAHSAKDLTPDQRLFNAHLNGDWKRQGFYRPTTEELAQMTRYEWVHDPQFRSGACATITPNLDGFFDTCPIPILIMEGKWDLTWSADKPQKMQAALPKSKLVVFEKSSHGPFSDEPELFFSELKKFVEQSPKPADADLAAWKKQTATIQQSSPAYVISGVLSSADGWGLEASKKIAQAYSKEWLNKLNAKKDSPALMRLGFALYDVKRYEDALTVFKKMNNLVWQGQMLDLLGRREEAIQCYQQALKTGSGFGSRHDQYGINVTPDYVKKLIEKPFVRVEAKRSLVPSDGAYFVLQFISSNEGWGMEASIKIAKAYKKEWLKQLQDCWDGSSALNRLGYALYDAKMYEDALAVFKQTDNAVWQGQMLDLLGKREEAVACYQQALKSGRAYGPRQDQYGLQIQPDYVKQRIEKPFVRIENNMK